MFCFIGRLVGSLTLGAHAQRGLQYLVCVSVCVCVCLRLLSDYTQATGRLMRDTNNFSATRNDCVREIWREKQVRKPICIMSTDLPRPGLARSAHRELSLRGRSRTALLSYQLAVRMRIVRIIALRMRIANALRQGLAL